MVGLSINISARAAWAPGLKNDAAWRSWSGHALPDDDGTAPDVSFIDALLRRRLGRLSRMALHVANQAAAEYESLAACRTLVVDSENRPRRGQFLPKFGNLAPPHSPAMVQGAGEKWTGAVDLQPTIPKSDRLLPTIFASRHGELSRTVAMLHALAADEAPSPAAFSLSVHNSAAGIFSIARGDPAPSTALAAGEETLLWALLEATIRLAADPLSPVLLVYADEPLPGEYQAFSKASEPAHALALLLQMGDGFQLEWDENRGHPPSPEPLSLALLEHLVGRRENLVWHGERLSVHGHA
jgi:hypothetical protein